MFVAAVTCSERAVPISKVDRSVLEALPAELREQVEQSWMKRPNNIPSPGLQLNTRPASPPPPLPASARHTLPAGTLVLQIPNQPGSPGIVLELPNYSQVETCVRCVTYGQVVF